MCKQQPQTNHPPVEELLGMGTSSAYQYLGIFASRMCLVLDRFLCIEDYKIPASRPLKEALAFFSKAKREISSNIKKTPGQVLSASELVSHFLRQRNRLDITSIQFCEMAISSLENLVNDPDRINRIEVECIIDFFSYLESVAKEVSPSPIKMRVAIES